MVKVELIYDMGKSSIAGTALRQPRKMVRGSLEDRVVEALCLKQRIGHNLELTAESLGIAAHELDAAVKFLNRLPWCLPAGGAAVVWKDGGFELHAAIEARIVTPEP